MGDTKGTASGQPQAKPETKQQRAARRDSAFRCSDCTASFGGVTSLGVHAASAHTAGMGG